MKPRFPISATKLIVAGRYILLGLAALLVLLSFWMPRQMDFDRKVTNMISSGSPVLESFRKLKRSFGGNEIVLAVYEDPNLLDAEGNGIQRLANVSERLAAVAGVRSTLSLNKLDTSLAPIYSKTNSYAIRMRKLFEGYTHNADGTIAVVVCMLKPEDKTTPSRRQTIDQLRDGIEDLPDGLKPGMLTGEPVMLVDGFRYVEQDGNRLSVWSSILLGLTVLVCFRSLRWMLICVGVVQLALLLTRVTMVVLGMRLSMVSSMLTAVVTVVGVATVVHLIVRFRDAVQLGKGPISALAQTTRILLIPVFWACVTDAVGFGSLKSASVGPVGDFGVMMGISCMAVLASVWLIVPALAVMGPQPKISIAPNSNDGGILRRVLKVIADLVERRSGLLAVISSLVIAASIWGIRYLEVETDFTRNFRRDAEIVQAYNFVETNLGGAGVGDILIPAPASLSWEYLRKVRQFEQQLEIESAQPGPLSGLSKVLSLADAVLVADPGLSIDSRATSWSEVKTKTGLSVMRARIPTFYAALHAEDPESPGSFYLRIMFRAREQQDASQKRALIERITQLGSEYFGPKRKDAVANQASPSVADASDDSDDSSSATLQESSQHIEGTPEVTGFFVLLTFLIDNIVGDQWKTFGIAVAGIGITMILAFRSLPLALIALIPNALPVLIVSGLMGWIKWIGWFDFRINMGSAMIAAVSLGLSIDSSIHYIFAFKRARSLGCSTSEAIHSAHSTVGLSMILATLALIVGFSVLTTSKFTPTVYFGTLVSLAMVGGLLGNLVILPIMLRAISRK